MREADAITAAKLRERLRTTRLPSDPTDVIMPPGSRNWPDGARERLLETLTPAGVLIPVIEREESGLQLLLTERSAELKQHAGQVSFPGGRMEPGDADVAATALRETYEEVGISREAVSVVGYLEPMPTVTGYAVTPVVGLIEASVELQLDRNEVAGAFEVPLTFFLDPGNRRYGRREVHGQHVRLIEFHYGGQRIWGATAFIILQLIKKLIIT